jgi:dethiobiotin synthetase
MKAEEKTEGRVFYSGFHPSSFILHPFRMNLFLTATDTGAGKTYVAAGIIRRLRAQGVDAVGFKPICCGSREDAEILCAAAGSDAPHINEVNPVWLRTPAAPYAAAIIENRPIDLALIRETFAVLCARHESVIVEGVGGWLAPIARDYMAADLAAEFALPVAVVVKNRLGALNHAALTVSHIRSSGQACLGLILNNGPESSDTAEIDPQEIARATNRALLEDLLGLPVLCEVETNQGIGWSPMWAV